MLMVRRTGLIALILCSVLLGTSHMHAQTPSVLGDRLGFDQAAATLTEAQGYLYRAYLDGAITGVTLTATCSGASSPFACVAPLPSLTTGTHTSQLTASVVLPPPDGRTIESVKSAVFTFRLFAAPESPTGQRIVPMP